MNRNLFLQLHVHSDRSHDSSTPISEYVCYLHNLTLDFDFAVLAITDHNILPITMERALEYSTKRVIVIPGIQWRLHHNIFERLSKRSTRREILTLGNHNDLRCYVNEKIQCCISDDDEIMNHVQEQHLLDYLMQNSDLALVVPHPKHFIIDYYGMSEIKYLKKKMESRGIDIPFFIESKTGYDPFPRILARYDGEYCIIGGSDAHDIKSLFGTESILSVTTTIPVDNMPLDSWEQIVEDRNVTSFSQLVKGILSTLERDNSRVTIKKHYGRSTAQLIGSIPRWIRRRCDNFPQNFFK